ncbi:nucleoside diphosphate kinase regulator [Sphingomonas sp. LY160]|uniref:nucleoside diphosphate kinase regulator n=1 Tax=Sphingomonas sp. LY160 TaxID=3095342 RepID=UPI002ADEF78E|nr:nucleoside diphosphate kinase regulator [Sphingomonas sp. LY160]MEA1073294.1 nucleoside diphosphate kinase regulator [Sphingomonas sp. LY160]
MQHAERRRGASKPAILLSDTDYDLIASYATGLEQAQPELADMLFKEINRARICPAAKVPDTVVKLGSKIAYFDDRSGVVRNVQLVLPGKANIDEGSISILTPVGAGLIGLRAGQSINWPGLDGSPRILSVLEVISAA